MFMFIYSAPLFEKLSTGKKGIRHANFTPSLEAKECITPPLFIGLGWVVVSLHSEGGSHKTQFNMQFSRKVGGEIIEMHSFLCQRPPAKQCNVPTSKVLQVYNGC